MNKYDRIFSGLLLEGIESASAGRNPTHPQTSGDDIAPVLDQGTNPDEMLTQGLKASVDAVQNDFNRRMKAFANALRPEAVKQMNIGKLKNEINNVFKYIDGIQVFSKSKIDALAQNPSAILAAFINSDPAKQSAFTNLHKKLDEFKKALDEIDGQLSTLKGQIDEFISDVSKTDEDSLTRMASGAESGAPSFGPAPGQSAGSSRGF